MIDVSKNKPSASKVYDHTTIAYTAIYDNNIPDCNRRQPRGISCGEKVANGRS
jgi:hypothetical protein